MSTEHKSIQVDIVQDLLNVFSKPSTRNNARSYSTEEPPLTVEIGDDPIDLPPSPKSADFHTHACGPKCLQLFKPIPNTAHLKRINPLIVPFHFGFTRMLVVVDCHNKGIGYGTPCGKLLTRSFHIKQYLSVVDRDATLCLDIDNFTFSPRFELRRYRVKAFDYLPDITCGQEDRPISLINTVYSSSNIRFNYIYTRDRRFDPQLKLDLDQLAQFNICCDCTDNCEDWSRCACQRLTYDSNFQLQNGYIFKRLYHKHMGGIFECNSNCGCNAKCPNRLVQKGLTCLLQLFRTYDKGWGVRALHFIPRGTFVAAYNCTVKSNTILESSVTSNTYVAEHDFIEVYSYEKRQLNPKWDIIQPDKSEREYLYGDDEMYSLDGTSDGNIGRFFNHSCEPNMFCQNVFTDLQDFRFPITALFAFRDVMPLEELCWDYNNYHDGENNFCNCGAICCVCPKY